MPKKSLPVAPANAFESLNVQRQKLIDGYIRHGQIAKAGRDAGYAESTCSSGSIYAIFRDPSMQDALAQRLEETALSAETVQSRLADIASTTLDDFVSWETTWEERDEWIPVADAVALMEKRVDMDDAYREMLTSAEMYSTEEEDKQMAARRRELMRLEAQAEHDPESLAQVRMPAVGREVARLDLDKARESGKLHLVKKIKQDSDGAVTVELHDRQSTLHHLDKMHHARQALAKEAEQKRDAAALGTALGKMGLSLTQINITNVNLDG